MNFKISSKPWKRKLPPKKVLIIRYQGMGDLVITLPYLTDFKRLYPNTQLHLLTRKEISSIPLSLTLFDKIIMVGGRRNVKFQFFLTIIKFPFLWMQRYDVVIDLQNHIISRVVRKCLATKAWCEFDKYSSASAGDRTKNTINSLGLVPVKLNISIDQEIQQLLHTKMIDAGWSGSKLIVVNPAGAFETRHWPLQNYVALAKLWLAIDKDLQFVVTGLRTKIGAQVDYLKQNLGNYLMDLTDVTDAAEAFALMRKSLLVISEDSGLMHMAWVQGVPTLALFGSSRSDWSAPLGDWSHCLNSSDLPCGNCLLEVCKYGDVHCLTRYTPEEVFRQGQLLINKMTTKR